jgi:hypothetical protein
MRISVAAVMVLVLLSILTVCPLAASEQCCKGSHGAPTSCPNTSLQHCPYLLLEKGKTAAATVTAMNAQEATTSPDFIVSDSYPVLENESRVPSSQGLYLRIRVLLI